MAGVVEKSSSVRWSRFESRRLTVALALSVLVHLLGWGGYELGKQLNWWPPLRMALMGKKSQPPQPPPEAKADEQMMFIDVNPEQATAEPPKNAKFYSAQNSQAANPAASRDTDTPQINGRQTDVPKTEEVPRQQISRLQPRAPPAPEEQPKTQSKPKLDPGDLALGKPQDSQPQETEQPRPRTLKQAYAQQDNRRPGPQVKQDGGARRQALAPSFDVLSTPFGDYYSQVFDAIRQYWYDELDSQKFANDRKGRVTLRFHLNYDGTVSDVEVLQNQVGDLLCYVCQKAVNATQPYAKWPSDMRRMVGDNYLQMTLTFIYN